MYERTKQGSQGLIQNMLVAATPASVDVLSWLLVRGVGAVTSSVQTGMCCGRPPEVVVVVGVHVGCGTLKR